MDSGWENVTMTTHSIEWIPAAFICLEDDLSTAGIGCSDKRGLTLRVAVVAVDEEFGTWIGLDTDQIMDLVHTLLKMRAELLESDGG